MPSRAAAPSHQDNYDFAAGVPLTALQDNIPVQGQVHDTPVVVAKRGASLFAVGAKCSHYGAPLHTGIVTERGIHCPWHHACFRLKDGSIERAPAMDVIAAYTAHVQDGVVTVSLQRKPRPGPHKALQAPPSVTIIGTGAAGMGAAAALRQGGYAGPITLFGAEGHEPYDRIKLSKGFLAGAVKQDHLGLGQLASKKDSWTVRKGTAVTAIDGSNKTLRLQDGSHHPYHALLIATGASPKRLSVPGSDLPHVHVLRSLDDAIALRDAAQPGKHVVIVGASFIGMEAAASLGKRGAEVHVIAMGQDHPMASVLGPTLGQKIAEAHAAAGIVVHRGRTVQSIAQDTVTLDNGETLTSHTVLVAIGVAPNDALAQAAGLHIKNGIEVDHHLRTSDPHIFAAGDVAAYPFTHDGSKTRIEHWAVAMQMGRVAAANMLGDKQSLQATPYFWTEHQSIKVRYVGHARKGAKEQVFRRKADDAMAVALLDDNEIAAVATVNCDGLSLEVEAALDAGLSHKVLGLLTRAFSEA